MRGTKVARRLLPPVAEAWHLQDGLEAFGVGVGEGRLCVLSARSQQPSDRLVCGGISCNLTPEFTGAGFPSDPFPVHLSPHRPAQKSR